MRKYVLVTMIALICGRGDEATAQVKTGSYAVHFTDKSATTYSLNNPLAFLTDRALARRSDQYISLDSTDLPVVQAYLDSVAVFPGVSFRFASKWFNAAIFDIDDLDYLDSIQALGFVKNTDEFIAKTNPTWKYGQEQFGEQNVYKTSTLDYGQAAPQLEMIQLDRLHAEGFTGEGMIITVMDAGFRSVNQNEAFAHLYPGRVLHEWDLIAGNKQIYLSGIDIHGRQVFSIIAAELPGDYLGSAPGADYVLLRTEDNTSESLLEEWAWVVGAEIADSIGTDVINSSLGYDVFDQGLNNHTFQDMDGASTVAAKGATMAARKGIAVVCSAGNEGQGRILTPADADSILTIGAVDGAGSYATFSSVGPSADGRVKPDVAAWGKAAKYTTSSGGVTSGNGTSYAAPIVAGAMACLMQKHPGRPVQEVLQAVRESSSQFATPDSLLGYGIPNFEKASGLLTVPAVSDGSFVHPNFSAKIVQGALQIVSETTGGLFQIFDLNGKLVQKGYLNQVKNVHIKDWQAGLYLVCHEDGGRIKVAIQ